jgi:pyruvate dehydrogenase (quinone)
MAGTVGQFLLHRLTAWDVRHVFGYPGDGINGILAAWTDGTKAAEGTPRFVQSRHEEMSALQAVGYAKYSGRLGVCLATSGPGAIHLLNGLYDAKLDHVPVLALVGQTDRSALGGAYQQEVDLLSLLKDAASDYVQMVTVPEQLPNVLDRAIRTALARRCPTALVIPADVQQLSYAAPGHAFKEVPSSLGFVPPVGVAADPEGVRRAAEVLNAGERVAVLVGQGARAARREVLEVAEALGAGVATALLGKDVVPGDVPFLTGTIGLLGTRPSYELMMGCDTLLTVGSSFPYTQYLPPLERARGVQIDHDASLIGMRYPYEVNLVGDAAATLRALLPLLTPRSDRRWRAGVEADVASWWDTIGRRSTVTAEPTNPVQVFWELNGRLPENVMISSDSGSSADWYGQCLRFRADTRGSLSGTLATMGAAVPYGIGAKFAHPDRPVIAFEGDGAMQMNGLAELITIERYWREWADPTFVTVVLHNNDLTQVTWEQRAMSGSPKFLDSQVLPDVDYAGFARGLGLVGLTVRRPEEIGAAWEDALAAGRPAVLDVHCNPNVPPIPPHATTEQVRSMVSALAGGDADRWEVLWLGARTKLRDYLPG